MKIQLNSSDLLRAISAVQKVMTSKNSLSILENALLSQTEGKYYITGGDTANQLTMPLPMTILHGDFKPVCLNVKQFSAALASIPSQPITIDIECGEKGGPVAVQHSTGNFKLNCLSADEYPTAPLMQNIVTEYQMPAAVVMGAIKNAVNNTASDELRMVMNGIYFDATADGIVNMVATDGHKMYKETYEHGVPFFTQGGACGIIIPKTVVAAICDAYRTSNVITISTDGNNIRLQGTDVQGETITLYARCIEGRYPNYNAVIPQNNSHHVTLSIKELTAAAKRVALFSSDSTNMLRISYEEVGALTLKAEDIDFAVSAKETVNTAECTLPIGYAIGLKATVLLAHLAYMPGDNLVMELDEPSRPCILRPDSPSGQMVRIPKTEDTPEVRTSLTCITMPMLLNE